jgi:phosphatidylglycerophosphate synthase
MRKAYSDFYPEKKRQGDRVIQPWVYYVLRPLSFRISIIISKIGVSANSVTIFGGLIMLYSFYFLLATNSDNIAIDTITFALLMNFWYFLDVVDGNIARISLMSSNDTLPKGGINGKLLDSTFGYIQIVYVPLIVGFSIYSADIENLEFYLYVGFLASFFSSLRIYLKKSIDDTYTNFDEISILNRFGYVILSSMLPILLLFSILSLVEWWVLLNLFLSFTSFLIVAFSAFTVACKK